jgi:hypothetical protein
MNTIKVGDLVTSEKVTGVLSLFKVTLVYEDPQFQLAYQDRVDMQRIAIKTGNT